MKEIAIIGGDLRIVNLAEMLTKDNIKIKVYALEKQESLSKIPQIKIGNSIEETVENVNIVIGPIPLSNDGIQVNTPLSSKQITLEELTSKIKGKKFLAGNIKKEYYDYMKTKEVEVIDLLKCEELVVLNTIATAEGALQIAMEETNKTIHGSNILVLGFGRVGKTVSYLLKGMGANVSCGARKNEDFAWIKTYGYQPIPFIHLKSKLNQFDIIINTIPTIILKEEELTYVKKECLLIDLASKPGGIDTNIANQLGIKTIWALALPGKVAPYTSAKYIKETIYHVLEENKE